MISGISCVENSVLPPSANGLMYNASESISQCVDCCFLLPLAIEIGFRHERVVHSETEASYTAVLERDRPSEQTFQLEILISTPHILGLGEPATQGDDFQANNVSIVTLTPDDNQVEIVYQIVGDKISERLETFLVSSCAIPNTPAFDCDGQDCYSELQVSVIDNDCKLLKFQTSICIFSFSL